ncbi:MAG: hypothetical protein ACYTEO_20030 [Planctomycetota bacterium]|jgi:hypothetical protein
MKKAMYGLMAVILVVGLVGCATMGVGEKEAKEGLAQPGPTVMVATPNVKMSSKAKITIVGAGFKPGQEVSVLFTTADGVQADIGYALKPKPVANKIGAWATTWSAGRYVKRKLVKEGAYTITVTDSEYNILAYAPVAFYKAKKAKKKK